MYLVVEHGLEELGQFPACSGSIPAIPRPRSGHAIVAKVVDYHIPESRDMLPETEVGSGPQTQTISSSRFI